MLVVEGIYDGETVTLNRLVPVKGKTAVSVQFSLDVDDTSVCARERTTGWLSEPWKESGFKPLERESLYGRT